MDPPNPNLPLEVKAEIVTDDIALLDKYCQTSKEVRFDECPRLYMKLLWSKYKLKPDTTGYITAFTNAHDVQARHKTVEDEIQRLRQIYFSEKVRLAKLEDLFLEEGLRRFKKKLFRLLRLGDPPIRKPFNIDFQNSDGTTLLEALLKIASGDVWFNRHRTLEFLLNAFDDANRMVGRYGAKVRSFTDLVSLIARAHLPPEALAPAKLMLELFEKEGAKVIEADVRVAFRDGNWDLPQREITKWLLDRLKEPLTVHADDLQSVTGHGEWESPWGENEKERFSWLLKRASHETVVWFVAELVCTDHETWATRVLTFMQPTPELLTETYEHLSESLRDRDMIQAMLLTTELSGMGWSAPSDGKVDRIMGYLRWLNNSHGEDIYRTLARWVAQAGQEGMAFRRREWLKLIVTEAKKEALIDAREEKKLLGRLEAVEIREH